MVRTARKEDEAEKMGQQACRGAILIRNPRKVSVKT